MTDLFKWRRYEAETILTCVRWYLRYALSSLRDCSAWLRNSISTDSYD